MLKLRTLFTHGITMLFDNEGGDANNNDADGGKTTEGGKSGSGGGDDDKGKSTEPKVETHTITVDGEEKILSAEEMKNYAQLGFSSTQRYQAASDKEKAAERGLRVETLVKSISGSDTPSEADIRELAGLLEIEPAEFLQSLKEGDPPQKTKDPKVDDDAIKNWFQKEFNASPAEVRATLEFSTQRHVNDARKEIREISDKAVDKDEIIGKMIVGEGKEEVLAEVKNMVAEDVLTKIKNGEPFGAEMVTATIQRVRSSLTKLGIPKKPNQQPIVLGLAPGEGLSSLIQADEPIKRVPSTEDDGEKNLIARYLQQAVKAARAMK